MQRSSQRQARRIIVLTALFVVGLFAAATLLSVAAASPPAPAKPQPEPAQPGVEVITMTATRSGEIGDLRALPKHERAPGAQLSVKDRAEMRPPPADIHGRGVTQMDPPPTMQAPVPAASASFDGLRQLGFVTQYLVVPPDPTGAVGPNHYVQGVNSGDFGTVVGIYAKNGTLLSSFGMNTVFAGQTGTSCDNDNYGDPQILYDSATDRWFILDFTGTVTPYRLCIMVSKTNDPVAGGWWLYSVGMADNLFPDYPKCGVWPDGYYCTANMFATNSFKNVRAFAFNKAQMQAGAASAQVVVGDLPARISGADVFSAVPSTYHVASGTPPAGRPNYLVVRWGIVDFRVWSFNVNWGGSSSITGPIQVSQTTFSSAPSTMATPGNSIETLGSRQVQPATYHRSASGVESIYVAWTLANPSSTGLPTVRYNQITVTGGTVVSPAAQTASFVPDTTIRRAQPGSSVDKDGNLLVAYTASSPTVNPGIRWAGRLATASANTWSEAETVAFSGPGTMTGTCGGTCTRFGDYQTMTLDVDGCTFWFTGEYYPANPHPSYPAFDWNTRIVSTKYASCAPLTSSATIGPGSLSFTAPAGQTSAAQTVTITNTGTATLVLQPRVLSGADAASFSTTTNTCASGPIAAGASCTIGVVFGPASSGSHSATLSFATNVVGGAPLTVALSGVVASPPTTTAALSPPPNAAGWNAGAVEVSLACAPASGLACASTTYSVDGGATQTYTGPFSVSGDLVHTVLFRSVGSDGAVEADKTQLVRIDATPPAVAAAASCGVTGLNGWCRDATRNVTTSASDVLSGLASTSCTREGAAVPCGTIAVGQGEHTVVVTATDLAGNTASASITLKLDNVAPSLAGSRAPLANAQGWNDGDVTVSWTCTDATSGVASAPSPAIVSDEGAGQSRSGTCTDEAGNSASSTVSGISIDRTPPSVTHAQSPAANAAGWNNGPVVVSFSCTDALSGVFAAPASAVLSGEGADQGASGTCTDAAGNAATATRSGIHIDLTPPTLADVGDIVAEATSAAGAHVSFDAPAASDALSGVEIVACDAAPGLFGLGDTTVACSASDAAGNVATTSFVVSVVDTTAPTIAPMADIGAEATSAAGATVVFDAPVTSDAVDGDGIAACAPASGGVFAIGATTVTCSASDAAGNAASATFVVTVADTTAPVIEAAADVVAEATSAAGATVLYGAPATTDAVDGEGVAACAPASGSVFALGSTTVTCTATDAAGNAAEPVSFVVTVQDTTAPAIQATQDLVVQASGLAGAYVTYDAPATSDAVDGDGVASCAPASGSYFARGNTTVTCVATDAAGNTATSTFQVRVVLVIQRALATEKANYTASEAALDGVRGTYSLRAGDGSPLANLTVQVRILRQVQLVGYIDSETLTGTTDADGDFTFAVPTSMAQPGASYLMLGSILTPGYPSGDAHGRYTVRLA
ncbi:MAG TPA: HYR domain-containing protein [Candidatus Thermoplasmatota archaeon]|nr:HYR domain-containing protein [Candidatus Thermoplasmatota archaeon]